MISNAVISAAIGAAGVVVSALVSRGVSISTAKKQIAAEIEQLSMKWEREKEQQLDSEIAEMHTKVSEFIREKSEENYINAITILNVLRSKDCHIPAVWLDDIYYSIESHDGRIKVDENKVKDTLARILEEYRKHSGQSNKPDH